MLPERTIKHVLKPPKLNSVLQLFCKRCPSEAYSCCCLSFHPLGLLKIAALEVFSKSLQSISVRVKIILWFPGYVFSSTSPSNVLSNVNCYSALFCHVTNVIWWLIIFGGAGQGSSSFVFFQMAEKHRCRGRQIFGGAKDFCLNFPKLARKKL